MIIYQNGIQDQWHFVIGNGATDREAFYGELEKQVGPQVQALGLTTGYVNTGGLFSGKKTHFAKYGGYMSLTCAEPFGTDLKVSWYLYYKGSSMVARKTESRMKWSNFFGNFTGRTRDKIMAFATVGKDCAERATQAILAMKQPPPSDQQSGHLGAV